ncbi:MAG: PEP-utilizing enzyme [Patescibacteria group bacterium]
MKNIFKDQKYLKHWAGSFNFLYDNILGYHNTRLLKDTLGTDLNPAIYIYKTGYTSAYFDEENYKSFGKKLAKEVEKDPQKALDWAKNITDATDKNLLFMKSKISQELDSKDYYQFLELFYEYSNWHRPVKVVVDFLSQDTLEKVLPALSKARIHAEPVYENHEKFIQNFSQQIGKKNGYKFENLLALSKDDVDLYFTSGNLPEESILVERAKGAVSIYEKGKCEIFVGKKAKEIEDNIIKIGDTPTIKGSIAFPGKIQGEVRVIFDPAKADHFKKGNILVTGMTRPEYLYLMQKAGAFVTDAGGILSHAAIVARELKKPCIIGTQVATKVLKDGDLVEVDANLGTVTIIKKAK